MQKKVKPLVLNDFVMRQFDPAQPSSNHIAWDPQDFLKRCNEYFKEESQLRDGYAPFCKHLFVPNFTPATCYYLPITDDNRHLLTSCFQARRESELPVLVRSFPKDKVIAKQCQWLDIILYSKAQIDQEEKAMNRVDQHADVDYEWGVISVKCQDHEGEIPMEPITMMRNALGKEEGGSGVPLDRQKYQKSVDFYQHHAVIM